MTSIPQLLQHENRFLGKQVKIQFGLQWAISVSIGFSRISSQVLSALVSCDHDKHIEKALQTKKRIHPLIEKTQLKRENKEEKICSMW